MVKRELTYKTDTITSQGWLGTNPELLNYKIHFIESLSDLALQGSVLDLDRMPVHPSGKYTYAPRIRRTLNAEYELGKGPIRFTWAVMTYDEYVNPTRIVAATLPTYSDYEAIDFPSVLFKLTETEYINNSSSWLIGLPKKVTVTHHAPGQSNQTRTTETQYNSLGQPWQVIIEPGKPEEVTTNNDFDDGFGNPTRTFVFKLGFGGRLSSVEYDSTGLHVTSKTNAEGHTMSIVPDPKCDAPKNTTDANGLITEFTYDQYCRGKRTDYPDGTSMTTSYEIQPGIVGGGNSIALPLLKVIQQATNSPTVTTYYDQLGRDVRVETQGFDGRLITAEKRYNTQGKMTRESLPYYPGGAKYWTKYYYDAIGRLERTVGTDNSESLIEYDGLTTITTNPKGQTQTKTTDVLGRIKIVFDADGKALNYSYDAVGNLLETRDPKDNKVKMGYDHVGNKIWMDDPDMGRWNYDYDFYGQLIKQTDAKNQVITSAYDDLGRLKTRTTVGITSHWEYDKDNNGIGTQGKLRRTWDTDGYERIHEYDALSRPSWTHETVNNVTTASLNSYNVNGKLNSVYYPARSNSIAYTYNSRGYLTKIYDYNYNGGSSIRKDLWVLDDMDAKGNVTQEHYGNGVNITRNYHPSRHYLRNIDSYLGSTPIQRLAYDMDSIGNLTSRRDRMTGTEEEFRYDKLNRLIENKNSLGTFSLDPVKYFSYEYDELGNMTYRSDVGIMRYGDRGYGPHAITSVQQNQGVNVPENVFNPRGDYHYDANGNLKSNGLRSISWTSFNKPKKMETTVDGVTRKVFYYYGTDFQRTKKYDQTKGKTTRYFGGGSVERISKGADIDWKYYIPVGATTLEIKYKQSGSNSSPTLTQTEEQYLFKDHLASTDVIVDDAGNIVERLSFNPWGERRDSV